MVFVVHGKVYRLQIDNPEGVYCGNHIQEFMQTANEDIQLVFHTDATVEDRGFRLVYETETVDSVGRN